MPTTAGGGDWSGAPGYRCDICGRRSETVGPVRGFDYASSICGGCCAISSDDDGHNEENHCRACKKYMYNTMSEVDNYCSDCVPLCPVCSEQFHPKYRDKCATRLDGIIRQMIEDTGDAVDDVLGEDAVDGEEIVTLCKKCKKRWRLRVETK